MLFHPYKPLKILGVTVGQGMIPRHRESSAQSIGNAVGNELVSQETVFDALFETSFFQRKVKTCPRLYQRSALKGLSIIHRRSAVTGARADSRYHLGPAIQWPNTSPRA